MRPALPRTPASENVFVPSDPANASYDARDSNGEYRAGRRCKASRHCRRAGGTLPHIADGGFHVTRVLPDRWLNELIVPHATCVWFAVTVHTSWDDEDAGFSTSPRAARRRCSVTTTQRYRGDHPPAERVQRGAAGIRLRPPRGVAGSAELHHPGYPLTHVSFTASGSRPRSRHRLGRFGDRAATHHRDAALRIMDPGLVGEA